MGIKLNWPSQSAKNLTGIEIYRTAGDVLTLDRNTLPTPLATLTADKTSYEDTTVVEKTIYNYWVASVKSGERVFSARLNKGYFLDTGPGPTDVKYGDWTTGYFGTVDVAELFTHLELNAQIGATVASYLPDLYHKFIYKGRIIFYPNLRTSILPYSTLYTFGLTTGNDDYAYLIPSGVTKRSQRRTVTKGGREYVLRMPFIADYKVPSGATLSQDQYANDGEWRNTMERLFLAATGKFSRWGDTAADTSSALNYPLATTFAPLYGAGNTWNSPGNSPASFVTSSPATGNSTMLVLELVLP
jgi:hypothetical protein